MTDFGEIIGEFLVESFEGLDRVEGELVELETRPDDADILSSIFRTIHSIKGASGFLEFGRLEMLAHAGENLLDALRGAKIAMNQDIASALLELGDQLRGILQTIEGDGNDTGATDPAIDELAGRLRALADDDAPASGSEAPGDVEAEADAPEAAEAPAEPAAEKKKTSTRKKATSRKKKASAEEAAETKAEPRAEDAVEPSAPKPPPAKNPEASPKRSAPRSSGPSAADSNIRVRVDQLDALMNLAGELVLSRNQIVQHAQANTDSVIAASAQRLNHVTTELQERIMQIRMQPIGLLFNKFPRVVRDLANQLEKDVELVVRGAETELDKSLLEAVKDPLTHLVRNSLDHGIETPAERESIGKAPKATLELAAFHESGQVVIEIRDDGRGIDRDRIAAKGVEKGLVSKQEVAQMDDRDVLDLLFQPGFSTAEKITNVSGRCVGMDVVKSNLQAVGGTVAIETEVGVGTTVVVRLPLTLAIIPALTVRSGQERFAIPQANLVELVLIEESRDERIEQIHGKPVFRLRGRLLSIVDLCETLGIGESEPANGTQAIVVVQAAGRRLGLLVDEILETEEIVVKPLDARVKGVGAYVGTTILSDGQVSLILDVAGIAFRAELTNDTALEELSHYREAGFVESEDLVLVDVSGNRRMGFHLDKVARFEELDSGSLERIGEHAVLQYRGGIMPVLDLERFFPSTEPQEARTKPRRRADKLHAVVHSTEAGDYAFLVDDVVDIVGPEADARRHESTERGVAEVVVVDGRVTEVIDVSAVLEGSFLKGSLLAEGERAVAAEAQDVAANEPHEVQICSFRLGHQLFGFDVLDVQEVLPPQHSTVVPLSDAEVRGLLNLRGDTVVLMDLAQRIGLRKPGEHAPHDTSMHIVLNTEHGVVSVLVDEIGEVLELSRDEFEPCPNSFDEARRRYSKGVYKVSDDLLLLQLDASAITEIAVAQDVPLGR